MHAPQLQPYILLCNFTQEDFLGCTDCRRTQGLFAWVLGNRRDECFFHTVNAHHLSIMQKGFGTAETHTLRHSLTCRIELGLSCRFRGDSDFDAESKHVGRGERERGWRERPVQVEREGERGAVRRRAASLFCSMSPPRFRIQCNGDLG